MKRMLAWLDRLICQWIYRAEMTRRCEQWEKGRKGSDQEDLRFHSHDDGRCRDDELEGVEEDEGVSRNTRPRRQRKAEQEEAMSEQELRSAVEALMREWRQPGFSMHVGGWYANRLEDALALLPASPAAGLREAFVDGGTYLVQDSLRFVVFDKLVAEAARRFPEESDFVSVPQGTTDAATRPWPAAPPADGRGSRGDTGRIAWAPRADVGTSAPATVVMAGGQPVGVHPMQNATAHRDQTEAIAKAGLAPATKGETP